MTSIEHVSQVPVSGRGSLTWNLHLTGGNLHAERGPTRLSTAAGGAERVFGLGRIIHSPIKRIGESRRL